ncbi:MAG TPA: LysR family transcriptional regulator [Noviherbaspirillum sp.]|jgi:DNA-binding transcriptional LysR family regulator|uniref:LysR family transcriptional regulator n=1 Tax=Noviherbaspirillum sp. TaxID=1926288 RepID=UPI002DDDBCC4|nr:LysR family transcriptional regulator [Noviherbaspirillum sp.]HEV2608796.1 LysR family transcriptional regulator [Noviherbaspirillum sp.]
MPATRSRIDLNLVRVFVTIYETRSVTVAAERLFLTQPSVSYALGKLRDALHDPLFMRGPQGLVPTACGEMTYRKFSAAMASIESAIEPTTGFDPQQSSQRFRIAMSDIGEMTFLPPIMEHMQREAPNVELEVVQVAIDEVAGWLAAGKVDAAVGNLPGLVGVVKNRKLFSEHYVCLVGAGNAAIGESLSLEDFLSGRHIVVSSPFSGHRLVEDILRQQGVSRKVILQVPHFTIVPNLMTINKDLLVTMPSRVGRYFALSGSLRALEVPIELPHFEVRMFWHEHQEEKRSHQWLRNVIYQALSRL